MSPNLCLENLVANDELDPKEAETHEKEPSSKVRKNHPSSNIIRKLEEGVSTRKKDKVNYMEMINNIFFTSSVEPKTNKKALKDECWIKAMQEEVSQFVRMMYRLLYLVQNLLMLLALNGC